MTTKEFFVVKRLSVTADSTEAINECAVSVARMHLQNKNGGGTHNGGAYAFEFGDHVVIPAPSAVAHRAMHLVHEERMRQRAAGFTPDHDDDHTDGAIAAASAAYIYPVWPAYNERRDNLPPAFWPFEEASWRYHPEDPIRNLVKGTALAMAELERLIRAQERKEKDREVSG